MATPGLKEAREAIGRGEVEDGRAMLDALHRSHGGEAEYADCRLELARRSGDMEEALGVGLRLTREFPAHTIQRYALADVASHLGRVGDALPAIEAIASRLPAPVASQVRAEAWHVMGMDAEVEGLAGAPMTQLGRMYVAQSIMRRKGIAAGIDMYRDAWVSPAARAETHGMQGTERDTYWWGQPVHPAVLKVLQRGGIGDFLLWARYLPLLEAAGIRIADGSGIETGMRPLLPMDAAADRDAVAAPRTRQAMWTDPFAVFAAMFPRHGYGNAKPYLRPPASAAAGRIAAAARTAAGGKPCWGIFWSANESHGNFALKSACLHHMRKLLDSPNVHWVVMQRGHQMKLWMDDPRHETSTNVTAPLGIDDTAALVKQLDGIVCVDTALAHIGGAVGARTCMLASHAPCWRYESFPKRSPWYASLEIFRQPTLGDWEGAAADLALAIGA